MKQAEQPPIDVEATKQPAEEKNMQLARIESGAVGRAMTVDELHKNLEFIREVMRKEMTEGQDYGKIPGTGDRKTLLQPGAQKLLMTFNLTEQVKKEVLREYPGFHREYEFTVAVTAANGKSWDGVGTCSTLESKYRYRKAERKCPKCGKETIIAGKDEYGGGWLCWKKKGGCGEKFPADSPAIANQPGGVTENEDPADVWNTVRKMSFKRALVHASINATNTSELWTQDMEEMVQNEEIQKEKSRQNAPGRSGGVSTHTPPAQNRAYPAKPSTAPANSAPAAQKPVAAAAKPRFATETTREWVIQEAGQGLGTLDEYLRNAGKLLPNETIKDLPLTLIPISRAQLAALLDAADKFAEGVDVAFPYPHNSAPEPAEKAKGPPKEAPKAKPKQILKAAAAAAEAASPEAHPLPPSAETTAKRDPDWFWGVFCPIPHKGQTKAAYEQNPDTIKSLYDELKAGNAEAGRRLWGFAWNWDPAPRTVGDRTYPVTEADKTFRAALDAFVDWEEKHGKDTQAEPEQPQFANRPALPVGSGDPGAEDFDPGEEDVPF